MKKSLLIFGAVLTTLSLTAYTFINWNETNPVSHEVSCQEAIVPSTPDKLAMPKEQAADFVYAIDNRFVTSITMERLKSARSIIDLLPEEATETLSSYHDVKLDLVPNNNQTAIQGANEVLNGDQLALLESTSYSSNFYLEARCQNMNTTTGHLENYHLVYYLTVVPERAAQYPSGHEALVAYLKENSKKQIKKVSPDQIEPGKIHFTVLKTGEIDDVKVASTCGLSTLDEHLVKLIKTMPGTWQAATDANGQKVDQTLVFFYGRKGC